MSTQNPIEEIERLIEDAGREVTVRTSDLTRARAVVAEAECDLARAEGELSGLEGALDALQGRSVVRSEGLVTRAPKGENAARIKQYMVQAGVAGAGGISKATIAAALGLSASSVTNALKNGWFVERESGWALAPEQQSKGTDAHADDEAGNR